MANAPNILKDDKYIKQVIAGEGLLPILPNDDVKAILIKEYINKAANNAWIKYIKENKEAHWSDWNNRLRTQHFIELKVNSMRLKYWYWKALKMK